MKLSSDTFQMRMLKTSRKVYEELSKSPNGYRRSISIFFRYLFNSIVFLSSVVNTIPPCHKYPMTYILAYLIFLKLFP